VEPKPRDYGRFYFPKDEYETAHRLSYALHCRLEPSDYAEHLGVPASEVQEDDYEYLGGLRDGDVVRHAEGCEKYCVNPMHLRNGSQRYNNLDQQLEKIRSQPLRDKVLKVKDEILALWKPPGGYAEFAQHYGIRMWEVVAILYRFGGRSLESLLNDNEPRQ
jgi:hypothetical protein